MNQGISNSFLQQVAAGGYGGSPNFAFHVEQPPVMTDMERLLLEQQAQQAEWQRRQEAGNRTQALGAVAGQLPQFGAQLGRFIHTLSDRRTKVDVAKDDRAVVRFLRAVGGR